MLFQVNINVTKNYLVEIEAKTKKDALKIANSLDTLIIYEIGSLTNVETRATEIEELK